ncbi:hypothetical protein niasHS_010375 [Heterodera schachtii]|uniref:Uncharacterized protein n=1 Tax=Heterodera schachtii TaxID=97005 RepID=A0ABD2J1A9_HETSC
MDSPHNCRSCRASVELSSASAVPMMGALTDAEIQQLKEQNQRRVKRVVALVAVAITTIAVILVALSLSLGPKIDQLVSESLESSQLSSAELLLGGPKRTTAEWHHPGQQQEKTKRDMRTNGGGTWTGS